MGLFSFLGKRKKPQVAIKPPVAKTSSGSSRGASRHRDDDDIIGSFIDPMSDIVNPLNPISPFNIMNRDDDRPVYEAAPGHHATYESPVEHHSHFSENSHHVPLSPGYESPSSGMDFGGHSHVDSTPSYSDPTPSSDYGSSGSDCGSSDCGGGGCD